MSCVTFVIRRSDCQPAGRSRDTRKILEDTRGTQQGYDKVARRLCRRNEECEGMSAKYAKGTQPSLPPTVPSRYSRVLCQ